MRHSEFWSRLEAALGPAYATAWSRQVAITALGSRTAVEALDDGVEPLVVWRAIHQALELPARDR